MSLGEAIQNNLGNVAARGGSSAPPAVQFLLHSLLPSPTFFIPFFLNSLCPCTHSIFQGVTINTLLTPVFGTE